MNEVSTIGLDLAKSVFQVHGVDASGGVVVRRKLTRAGLVPFFSALPPCLVGMEACGTAHHWARTLSGLGHEVRLIAPSYVKAYVKRQKNDAADAEAICEAVTRPSMRFVPVKSAGQQAELALHRSRELLVRQRTQSANSLRSHLAEFGIVAAQGIERVREMKALFEGPGDERVPEAARFALQILMGQLEALDTAIKSFDTRILVTHRQSEASRRLATIPGIGPVIASALLSTVGDASAFTSGRHFAAWIGLVPRQNSSGGRQRLGGISKMGDRYLRKLLVTGATSLIRQRGKTDPWLKSLLERKPFRVVAVALANKTARIAWAVMTKGETYTKPVAAA
jgi:transposase